MFLGAVWFISPSKILLWVGSGACPSGKLWNIRLSEIAYCAFWMQLDGKSDCQKCTVYIYKEKKLSNPLLNSICTAHKEKKTDRICCFILSDCSCSNFCHCLKTTRNKKKWTSVVCGGCKQTHRTSRPLPTGLKYYYVFYILQYCARRRFSYWLALLQTFP